MTSPSDRTLRRLAWGVWCFVAIMVALAVPLSLMDRGSTAE